MTPLLSDPISTPAPRSSPSAERDSHDESSVVGACQWFHYEDEATLDRAVELLRELGVRHLRTGISWADYHRAGGREWYDHQFDRLREFDLLVSIWHTPPSLSENGRCSGPPRRLKDYADFVWLALQRWGDRIGHVELWNEPNNRLKWDFENCDPRWDKFGRMVGMAARTAQMCDVPTVLGGMTPVDPQWLGLLREAGALEDVDVIAVHGFPGDVVVGRHLLGVGAGLGRVGGEAGADPRSWRGAAGVGNRDGAGDVGPGGGATCVRGGAVGATYRRGGGPGGAGVLVFADRPRPCPRGDRGVPC